MALRRDWIGTKEMKVRTVVEVALAETTIRITIIAKEGLEIKVVKGLVVGAIVTTTEKDDIATEIGIMTIQEIGTEEEAEKQGIEIVT